MRIVTLVDNKSDNKKLQSVHGLSLYIEVNDKKILFDIGPNNYYIKNAKKLGINLSEVDYLIISHGHYDHGSGIRQFIKINSKAEIYLSKRAFEDHVKTIGRKIEDIGIGKPPKTDRIRYVYREMVSLTSNVFICDKVEYKKQEIGDSNLMIYEEGKYIEDHFHHEIYLLIQQESHNVLITGCSHKGIENIIDSIEKNSKRKITHVIGGLHFSHYDSFNFKQTDFLQKLGEKLSNRKNIQVHACHCTGDDAYFELKRTMKSNINQLVTGSVIEI